MNFTKKNIKILMLLIVFTIGVLVCFQNLDVVGNCFRYAFGMISPFILGGCLAFMLNIPMNFFERKLFVKDNKFTRKAKRPLSLILAIVVILAVVTGVVVIVVPKLSDTLAQVVYTAQRSIPKLKVFVNQYVNDDQINEILNQYSNFDANKLFNMLIDFFRSDVTTNFLGSTVGVVRGIVNSVVNVAIGFVFAIYILLAKETLSRQISKSLKAIFNKKIYDYIIKVSELSYTTFANFIT